jgi:hypothetical protein
MCLWQPYRGDGKCFVVRGGDSELNLALPLCHEGQHGGSIGSEGCESQVGMKRGKERCDRSLTVPYGIGCQLNQLIRNNLLFTMPACSQSPCKSAELAAAYRVCAACHGFGFVRNTAATAFDVL